MRWLTDTLFNAAVADQYPVFIIQNADVLGLFGWEQTDRKYFSYAELQPFLRQIEEQGALAEKLQSVERSAYQNAVVNLRNSVRPLPAVEEQSAAGGRKNWASELESYARGLPAAGKAARQRETGKTFDQTKLHKTGGLIQRNQQMAEIAYILAVPARVCSSRRMALRR